MSRPRNPRYFPRMKVRGARRRGLAPYQRAYRAFDRLAAASARTAWAFRTMAASMREHPHDAEWIDDKEKTDDH